MKKTFYTVRFRKWGANGYTTEWFDNISEAKRFAAGNYCDKVVVRTYKDPEKIHQAELNVYMADRYGF